ncbi:MAG: hypothetical protein DMD62_08200 [Gemmatimonadetes bacterium]|nr:MAG: hypothetical protein DMD62_08200 [Gemmatimonadota bacterium]
MHRRQRVFHEEVHLGRGLVDRNHEPARAGGHRIRVAHLLGRSGTDRREHEHAVIAESHRFRRDVALAAAELTRALGHAARPGRLNGIPGDPRRCATILELEDLQDLARTLVRRPCDRGQSPRDGDRRTVGRRAIGHDVVDMRDRAIAGYECGRDVGDAVEPDGDDVGARRIGMAQLDAIAPARVAADRIDRPRALARHMMQHDHRLGERDGITPTAQHAAAHAHGLGRERRRCEADGDDCAGAQQCCASTA